MSVLQQLITWDREFFNKINGEWTNSFFDTLFPFVRNAVVWVPFYLFLFFFAIINYKRIGWFWILIGIMSVASSDMISSRLIKEAVVRLRPCHDESLAAHIRFLVKYCPISSSFTSSHAANHFALAMFIYGTLRKEIGKWLWLIFLWAFMISYAQVYVGVHYPLDIICGGIVGCLIGYAWAKFFSHNFSFQPPKA